MKVDQRRVTAAGSVPRSCAGGLWSAIAQDIRYGLKLLLASPAFTCTSVIALGLGIGASAAIFSVLHAVILQPLPFERPDRLVTIWESDPRRGSQEIEVSYGTFLDWRKQSHVFDDLAIVSSVNLDMPLTEGDEPQQVESTIVSHTFFPVLGVKAAHGRLFLPEDDRPGAPGRIVVSHRLWKSRFGMDPKLVGRQVRMEDTTAEVIGILPQGFDFPKDVDVWAPVLAVAPGLDKDRRLRIFRAVARLRPGVSIEQARAELAVVAKRLDEQSPAGQGGYGITMTSMIDTVFGSARTALWVLMGAVILVLLIACLNVGNLLLARGTVREREMSIRAALGAGRGRLVRQLLAESVVLASLGTLLGLVILQFALRGVALLAPEDIPRIDEVSINRAVLAFTVLLAFATVLVFGILPAFQGSRPDLARTLRDTGLSASASARRVRLRNVLVVGEVSLAVMLAVGAGLLVRSFRELSSLQPGFNPDNVLTFRVTLGSKHQTQEQRRQFYGSLIEKLKAIPGVESAAAILLRPLSGAVGWDNSFTIYGQTPDQQASNPNANYEAISPGYFSTMRIPLLAGRDVSSSDVEKGHGVVIVSESLARKHWGVEGAIGKQLKLGKPNGPQPWLTVVGVSKDVRYREWEAVRTDLYVPYTQRAQHRSDFVVRTSGDPLALAPAVREAVRSVYKDQAISNVTSMGALVDAALARARFNMLLLTVFAGCAILLAGIGVYGLISYFVAQRTGEIGIRLALGANPVAVIRLVLGQGLALIGAGLCIGLCGGFIFTRTMSSLVYGVKTWDTGMYAGVLGVVIVAGSLACLLPAVRAARLNPAKVLR